MIDGNQASSKWQRDLVESFFIKEDQKLIEELKTMRKMKETKENLSKVSGIHNDAVLQKLVDLEVQPETVASLAIVPLVEVAWADGDVDEKEKKAILKGIATAGFSSSGVDHSLLESWLLRKPPQKMMAAWKHYIHGLCGRLTDKERTALKEEILLHARTVAEASGGFLGLTSSISAEEKAMLKKIEEAFSVC